MAYPARIKGLWQSAKRVPGQTPLRIKLIVVMLVLVTAALTIISVAGIAILRNYLLQRADSELKAAAINSNASAIVSTYLFAGGRTTQPDFGGLSIQWLPSNGNLQQVVAEYSGYQVGLPHLVPGPAVGRSDSWLITPIRAKNHSQSWLNTLNPKSSPVSTPVTVGATAGDGRWRVVSSAARFRLPSGQIVSGSIIIGIDVTSEYRTINELTAVDVIVSSALLLVLAVLGIVVIRRSMRPLRDIERTAEAIAAGDLGKRVPERDPRTEVGRLGRSLNAMLAHIEVAFRARTASEEAARRSEEAARRSALNASRSEDRMRQFVADASHELRTPLTAIRGFAEYYRQRGGVGGGGGGAAADAATPEAATAGVASTEAATADAPNGLPSGLMSGAELDRLIERVEGEAKRMGVLVDDLLLLARLDQQRQLDFRTVDLLAIAADALHDARVMAPQRTINLTVGTTDAPLVTGDEVGLRQVVGNLMSNAMMHTPEGTPIEITIRSGALSNGQGPGEPAVILEVSDHGGGLSKEQQEHVFERFYRADRARSRTAGGTGLGLAIVSAMVSAHHGHVWVESEPGQGATFGFALPLAPEARALPTSPVN